MKTKRITALILAGVIFCSCPVYASENVPENNETSTDIAPETNIDYSSVSDTISAGGNDVTASSAQQYIDSFADSGSMTLDGLKQSAQQMNIRDMLNNGNYEAVYGDVMKSIEENNPMKISMAIGSQMKIPVPENIAAEVSIMDYSSTYDVGLLNLQYMALSQSYTDNFIKAESAQKSINCMELFNSTYGDLASSLKLEEPKIPDDFNPDKMVEKMSTEMGNMYISSTTKGSFANIKNSISIGNIFNTASTGLTGAYDRGVPSISFSDVPSTPLSGAYSSVASSASSPSTEMYNKFLGWDKDNASIASGWQQTTASNHSSPANMVSGAANAVQQKAGGAITNLAKRLSTLPWQSKPNPGLFALSMTPSLTLNTMWVQIKNKFKPKTNYNTQTPFEYFMNKFKNK